MSLLQNIIKEYKKRNPKTLEEIEVEDVSDGIVSSYRAIKMFEKVSELRFKYRYYPDPEEGAYFICPDCNTENGVSSHGFDNDYCKCEKRLSSESSHVNNVVRKAVSHIEVIYSGV